MLYVWAYVCMHLAFWVHTGLYDVTKHVTKAVHDVGYASEQHQSPGLESPRPSSSSNHPTGDVTAAKKTKGFVRRGLVCMNNFKYMI